MSTSLSTNFGESASTSARSTLSARMRAAGFEEVDMQGHPFVTDDLSKETYAGALVPLMADFVGTDEAEGWAAEQRQLAALSLDLLSVTSGGKAPALSRRQPEIDRVAPTDLRTNMPDQERTAACVNRSSAT